MIRLRFNSLAGTDPAIVGPRRSSGLKAHCCKRGRTITVVAVTPIITGSWANVSCRVMNASRRRACSSWDRPAQPPRASVLSNRCAFPMAPVTPIVRCRGICRRA